MTERTYCGRCHDCGTKLRRCLDGEEWCPFCVRYRRYRSHGWGMQSDLSPCPSDEALAIMALSLAEYGQELKDSVPKEESV